MSMSLSSSTGTTWYCFSRFFYQPLPEPPLGFSSYIECPPRRRDAMPSWRLTIGYFCGQKYSR